MSKVLRQSDTSNWSDTSDRTMKREDTSDPTPGATVEFEDATSESVSGFVINNVDTPLPEFFGRYRRVSFIGRGGFGEVWRAFDPELDCFVAVKTPRTDRKFPPELISRFLEEGRKLANLRDCHGVVTVLDVGNENGFAYIVSELLDGDSLDVRLRNNPLSRTEAVQLTAEIAEILHTAHLRDIVHRDIKPGNILLSKTGRPTILDFGLAVTEKEQLSESHGTVGTLAFMSPEQASGNSRHANAQSDIYSVGVILYRMLTGRLPFVADDAEGYRQQIINRPPRALRTIDDGLPNELEHICLKCLEKDPGQRYRTAGDLAADLRKTLQPDVRGRLFGRLFLPVVVLLMATILGLVVAIAAGLFNEAKKNDRPFPMIPDAELELFKKYPLLKVEPKTIRGLGAIGKGDGKHFDEKAEMLDILHRGPGLYELGKIERDNYTLQMDITRRGIWEGKAGFFIGLNDRTVDGDEEIGRQDRRTGQYFLICRNTGENAPEFPLMIIRYDIGRKHGTEISNPNLSYFAYLPKPVEGRPTQLELKVAGGRLASVRWGGQEIKELVDEELNALYSPDDYRGSFGIATIHVGGVSFKNVTITVDGK